MSQSKKERELQREKEFVLRDRISDEPSLLPGFDEPLASAKEVPVRRTGGADVIVVDAGGQIAIVECKRASNDESRREVIGQVFEYAAMLWKNNYEDLKRIFSARGRPLTKPFEGVEGWDEEIFGQSISQRLRDGDFRLIIAVDEMTTPLKKRLVRTVALLNSYMPSIQVEVVVPSDGPDGVYGGPKAICRLKPKLKRWALIEQIDSEDARLVVEDLFEWADGMEGGEVEIKDVRGIVKVRGRRLFSVELPREVRVSLGTKGRPWNESTVQLVRELDEIGVRLDGDPPRGRPRSSVEVLADDTTRVHFLELMEGRLETSGRPGSDSHD